MTKESANKKILIMAGGTGGHVYPALSIAQYLISKGIQVEWLGTRNGLEATVIPEARIPLHFISIAGLRGSSLLRKILSPFVIAVAVLQSIFKVMKVKPGCVLGMGGFVTGPGGLAAWMLRKNLLIHEQNAIAGFTNQLLFPFASTVMEAFPGSFERKKKLSRNFFTKTLIKPDSTIVVGNPVRKEIAELDTESLGMNAKPQERKSEGQHFRVLILGGSLGAVAINEAIPVMLALMSVQNRPEVLHQCGGRNLEATEACYHQCDIELGGDIKVKPFIDDMAQAYAWADLIIARAGAMTVSEIATAGLASILIPYPYAVDDHQTENAGYLVRAGAAEVIQQTELSPEHLLSVLEKFSSNTEFLYKASRQARDASITDATEKAARLCMEACYA